MINKIVLLFEGHNIHETIAHECVHAKQFDDNRLRVDFSEGFIMFNGEKYSQFKLGLMPYNDRPWEREANELMSEVAMKARELLANKKNVA